ncbi:MAG: hypothetical protein V2I38_04750, partial [Alcanivoracaceae bacterium]|jgi:ABC-type hemin transport system ATPase subunit|nr:hypothetical protein [Alcanivoracaceae bacterium]
LAASAASRLWLLQHGRLVADGKPEDVLQPARLERVYGIRARVERAGTLRVYLEGCSEQLPEPVWSGM